MGKKSNKPGKNGFGLPKSGIAPNAPEPKKVGDKPEKIKLSKRAKKIWKRLKHNGIVRVTFADDIKNLEDCGNIARKVMEKFSGASVLGVLESNGSVRLSCSPCCGEWIFIVPNRVPSM